MIIKQVVNVSESWPTTLFPAFDRNLYQVKPDWLSNAAPIDDEPYQVRGSAPAPGVFRTGYFENCAEFKRCKFIQAWQWFEVELLALRKFQKNYRDLTQDEKNYCVQKFKGLTTSNGWISNQHGTDLYNCYPCGGDEARRGADPLVDPLICGGTIVEGLDIQTNSHGDKMVLLRSFDVNQPPPPATLELLQKDTRILTALTVRPGKTIGNFPHLGGLPVPWAYVTTHLCWFKLENLTPLVST